MSIDIDTARRVAKLARIRVAEADLPGLAGELSGILTFMEQLNEVDVEGVENRGPVCDWPGSGTIKRALRPSPNPRAKPQL